MLLQTHRHLATTHASSSSVVDKASYWNVEPSSVSFCIFNLFYLHSLSWNTCLDNSLALSSILQELGIDGNLLLMTYSFSLMTPFMSMWFRTRYFSLTCSQLTFRCIGFILRGDEWAFGRRSVTSNVMGERLVVDFRNLVWISDCGYWVIFVYTFLFWLLF
jgi:hypothetical protein